MKHVIDNKGAKTKPWRYRILEGSKEIFSENYKEQAAAMSKRRAVVTGKNEG